MKAGRFDGYDGRRPMPRPGTKGSNTGHWQKTRGKRKAASPKPGKGQGSPRMGASYDAKDLAVAAWWAAKKGIPLAEVLRAALFAYVLPLRADYEREK